MTTPDFTKRPDPTPAPPVSRPTPGGAYPPPAPAGVPQAGWGAPPTAEPGLNPALGILGALAATAVIAAIYGLVLAESRFAVSYILIIGGLVGGAILGRTALPKIVAGALAAVFVGGFGFAATVYGSFGQLAKQVGDATGEDISFGFAVRHVSVSDALHITNAGIWLFFAVAVVLSFVYGYSGGRRFGRRRRAF